MSTPPNAPSISEKGLRHLWRWARHGIADTNEAYMVRLLVATTLRDRGLQLDHDQCRCIDETMTVLLEHEGKPDA